MGCCYQLCSTSKLQNLYLRSVLSSPFVGWLQIYNGLGLLLVSLHPKLSAHRFAGPAIFAGTLVFAGSIIALILSPRSEPFNGAHDCEWLTIMPILRSRILGPVTPVGGMILIAGWISLAF